MSWLASACIVLSLAAVEQSHSKEQTDTAQSEKKQAAPAVPEKAAADSSKTAQPGERYQGKAAEKRPPARKDGPWLQWKSDFAVSDVVAVCALGVTLLTLVMTALFLTYTIKTWEQMKRANDDAEKRYEESKLDIEKSLQLTRDGQSDTRRAVAIAEGQLRAVVDVTRASIAIDSIDTTSWYENGVPNDIAVTFKNTGHTPAINATPSGFRVVDISVFELREPGPEDTQNVVHVVGAGAPVTFIVNKPVMARVADIPDVAEGRRIMCVVGGMRYNDIFNPTDRHIFQYGARYSMAQSLWIIYASRNV